VRDLQRLSPAQMLRLSAAAAPQRAARRLLQAGGPQVGGFQAAKYFTYVFMALAIAVVGMMCVLCGLHCVRRLRMRRELEADDVRPGRPSRGAVPLVSIQLRPGAREPADDLVAIKMFDAVFVRQPNGDTDYAYSPDLPMCVLEPEASPERKLAAARAARRARSLQRYGPDLGDRRAVRRGAGGAHAELAEVVGRHMPGGQTSAARRVRREARRRARAAAAAADSQGSDGAGSDGPPASEVSTVPDTVQPFFADRGRNPAPRIPSMGSGELSAAGAPTASSLRRDRQRSPSRHEHHRSRRSRQRSSSRGGDSDDAGGFTGLPSAGVRANSGHTSSLSRMTSGSSSRPS